MDLAHAQLFEPELPKHAENVKAELHRAVEVLEDALNNVPADVQRWTLGPVTVQSKAGEVIVGEFQQAEQSGAIKRLGGWRAAVGTRLIRLGNWIMGS